MASAPGNEFEPASGADIEEKPSFINIALVAAAILILRATEVAARNTARALCRFCLVGQPEAGQRHSRQSDAESLQRLTSCD